MANRHNIMILFVDILSRENFVIVNTEQKLYYTALIDDNKTIMMRGCTDIIVLNPKTMRLGIVDLKTTKKSPFGLEKSVLKKRYEIQLRVYAFMLKKRLEMDYVPDIYLVGACEDSQKIAMWKFPLEEEDVGSLQAASGLYPDVYSPMI